MIGRLAIDFIVCRGEDGRWQPFALEVNLRMGGTTHPYQTLARLTGGTYDPQKALYTHARTVLARAGDRRAFRARTPRLQAALDMLG